MGSAQESSTRQREQGKACWKCGASIDPGLWPGGERLCSACERASTASAVKLHRVEMWFTWVGDRWRCQFSYEGSLLRTVHFTDEAKIEQVARAGGAPMMLEDRHAIESGIAKRRGRLILRLTDAQLHKLKG